MIKCFSCFRGKTQSHTSRIVSLLQQVTSKRTCNVETAPPAIADMIPKPRMSGWMSHFTLWVVVVVTAVGFVFFSFSSPSRHLPWLLEKYNGNGRSHNGAIWNESNDNACIFQYHWMPWWLFPRVPMDTMWFNVDCCCSTLAVCSVISRQRQGRHWLSSFSLSLSLYWWSNCTMLKQDQMGYPPNDGYEHKETAEPGPRIGRWVTVENNPSTVGSKG